MLGLPYPGGPSIAKAAEGGDPTAYRFPRGLSQDRQTLDFSFSGLKTAVRYALFGYGKPEAALPPPTPRQVADLAASFQEAVVDALVSRSLLALQKTGHPRLCVGGGVAANRRLRQRLTEAAHARGFALHIAPPELCTDNAVMGAIAFEKLRYGLTDPLDVDIVPGLVRG
jgi:N6-L-threonylcarbamoyladenine synthase